MKEVQITGSIVLYRNDFAIVEAAVKSFLSTGLNVFLFLVDNSPGRELEKLASIDPSRIHYVFNNGNPGFGTAHNIALSHGSRFNAGYHLVLNPDVYFEPDTLEQLYYYMEEHRDTGQVMPRVLYPNGSLQYLCRKNPTFSNLFSRRFFPRFVRDLLAKKMGKYEYKDHDYLQPIYNVPFLSGCFMFLRTDILKEIGGFDEHFFLYMEDADLTRRMLQRSRTVYFPDVHVYHHYTKGSYTNLKLTWHHLRSAVTYFNKWGWLNSKTQHHQV
ncbi:glycosyltransferase [Niabella hibiscisoli]|uniref:glycosyltransferase n=1 Tax=Niabella hibiscisoli TaxID=1825928 RepID=UPI001F0FCAE9|nr:glycosyltransferase family 2 protein [Niabella hibiscisoli]MCH5720083.1 glycosyltransferase family 2 protein [Niabella hibiscisoli]